MHSVLALFLLLQAPFATASDDDFRGNLARRYTDKLFVLKGFPTGTRLRFDADGTLLRGGYPGSFGLDGNIHVESVNVRPDRIEISGRRAFLSFNATTRRFEEYSTRDKMTLEFARKPNVPVETGITAVLMTLEQTARTLPPFWEKFLIGAPATPSETVTDPETGQIVPRASEAQGLVPYSLRPLSPQYPQDLQFYGITGSVVLRVIVDEQGNPRVADIVTPLGFGLDQLAIDAVNKWDYQPAKRDGKPVKVYTRVQLNFFPRR